MTAHRPTTDTILAAKALACSDKGLADMYLQWRHYLEVSLDSEGVHTHRHTVDRGYARRGRNDAGVLQTRAANRVEERYAWLVAHVTDPAASLGGAADTAARELVGAAVEAAVSHNATYAKALWRSTLENILVLTPEGVFTDRRQRHELTVRCVVGSPVSVKGYARWGSGAMQWPGTVAAAETGTRAAADASARAASRPAPSGRFDILLRPGWSGVFFHETVGHGLEDDGPPAQSVLAGRLGNQISRVPFDVVDDPSLTGEFGSYRVDDEGTSARPTTLVTEGTVTALLSGRFTASRSAVPVTANGRRASWRDLPQTRMSNLVVTASGTRTAETGELSLTGGSKAVVVVDTLRGGAMAPDGSFQFTAASGRLIRGSLVTPIRDFIVAGDVVEALAGVVAVGADVKISHGRCGKAGHEVCVGVGGPSVLIADLEVRGG